MNKKTNPIITYHDESRNIHFVLDPTTIEILKYYSEVSKGKKQGLKTFEPIIANTIFNESWLPLTRKMFNETLQTLADMNLIAHVTRNKTDMIHINPKFLLKVLPVITQQNEQEVFDQWNAQIHLTYLQNNHPYYYIKDYLKLFWRDEIDEIETSFEQQTEVIKVGELKGLMNESIKHRLNELILNSETIVTVSNN